jgi:hypothetical protein
VRGLYHSENKLSSIKKHRDNTASVAGLPRGWLVLMRRDHEYKLKTCPLMDWDLIYTTEFVMISNRSQFRAVGLTFSTRGSGV